jgi:hypothetical protein
MNITLSADEELIRKAREYAKRHNSSLNNLVRSYLEQITNEMNREEAAQEFEALCTENAGESDPGYRFNRAEEYKRK